MKTVRCTTIFSEQTDSSSLDEVLTVTATFKAGDKPSITISAGEDSLSLPLLDGYKVAKLLAKVLDEVTADLKQPIPGQYPRRTEEVE